MKKIIKGLSAIILMLSILLFLAIVIFNLIIIIRIMFFGISVGNGPDSIWFYRQTLYGVSGIRTYYSVLKELILMIEIPISIVCIIYQIIYFKLIRKK